MKKEEVLIAHREDLLKCVKEKDIHLINFDDLKGTLMPFQENGIVLFIDNNGDTKVLKNRYGGRGMVTDPKALPIDLSWMWHCSGNPKNVINYSELIDDQSLAKSLSCAAGFGFRTAMRYMEELNLIKMGDIDRSPNPADQEKWNLSFENEETRENNS